MLVLLLAAALCVGVAVFSPLFIPFGEPAVSGAQTGAAFPAGAGVGLEEGGP